MNNEKYSNYRTISKPDSCNNCDYLTRTHYQGVAGCKKFEEIRTDCNNVEWRTCDFWKKKYVPTEREVILNKLSARERVILGV